MLSISKKADVHEKTVQRAARGDFNKKFERVPGTWGKYRRRKNSKVEVKHWYDGVDELIVQWVRDNKIHYTRIEVVKHDVIIVHNRGWRRK